MKLIYLAVLALTLSACNMVKNPDGTYNVDNLGKDGGGACMGKKGSKEFCVPRVSSEACYTTYAREGYQISYAEGGECKSAW